MAFVIVLLLSILANAAASALASLFFGWVFMLMIGVIHHEWLHGMPTIGYWWAVLITFMLRIVLMNLNDSEED